MVDIQACTTILNRAYRCATMSGDTVRTRRHKYSDIETGACTYISMAVHNQGHFRSVVSVHCEPAGIRNVQAWKKNPCARKRVTRGRLGYLYRISYHVSSRQPRSTLHKSRVRDDKPIDTIRSSLPSSAPNPGIVDRRASL